MQTVEDTAGRRYLLEQRSARSSRVRDPASGAVQHLPNDELRVVEDASPLATAAQGVAPSIRRQLDRVADERAVGLLAELAARGPLSARAVLDTYELCESDLHGRVADLRAAGLVEPAAVGGEPGYGLTGDGRRALDGRQPTGADS